MHCDYTLYLLATHLDYPNYTGAFWGGPPCENHAIRGMFYDHPVKTKPKVVIKEAPWSGVHLHGHRKGKAPPPPQH